MSDEYDFTVEVYFEDDSTLVNAVAQLVINNIFPLHNLYNLNSILNVDTKRTIICICLRGHYICTNIALAKHREKRNFVERCLNSKSSLIIRSSEELSRFMTLYLLGFSKLRDFIDIEDRI